MLPPALRRLVEQRKAENASEVWTKALVLSWTDVGAAMRMLEHGDFGSSVETQKATLLTFLVQEKLDILAEGLSLLTDPTERNRVSSSAFNHWKNTSPRDLGAYAMKALDGAIKNRALQAAITGLQTKGDNLEAIDLLKKMPLSRERAVVLDEFAFGFAQNDPHGALQWVKTLELADERVAAQRRVIQSSSQAMETTALIEMANQELDPEMRRTWVACIADKLIVDDLPRAIEWAKSLPAENRGAVDRKIAISTANTNLDTATQMVLRLEDVRGRQTALDAITHKIAQKDVRLAGDWMTSLPLEYQEFVAGKIASEWFDIDSEAASTWVGNLPVGRVRDRAIVGLANRLALFDRKAAQELVTKVSDPGIRRLAKQLPSQRP